jgi:2-polyprenyl-3-methyl-5-hydroxy-6-metoxy-1,4-benzoquinol methylase
MHHYREYGFKTGAPSHMHQHFIGPLLELSGGRKNKARVLDVGCGNGSTVGEFFALGCKVVGIDLSEEGIERARKTYPAARFECLPADDHILENLQCEPFDVVISTEVIEHLYDPHSFVRGCYRALRPGGRFVLSTPYHGYLKNLLLSFFNRWDRHANPLWHGGHIKLWSRKTLSQLLTESGFVNLQFRGAGRVPYLWMTMLMSGDRPERLTS